MPRNRNTGHLVGPSAQLQELRGRVVPALFRVSGGEVVGGGERVFK